MNAFTSLKYQIETVKTKFRTVNSATQLRNLLKKRLKSDLSSTFSCTFCGQHPFQFTNLLLLHSQWLQYNGLGLARVRYRCEDDNK